MKKIIMIISLLGAIMASCNKDSEGVSTMTTYPTVELKGDEALTILVGGSYTESGVIAKEGDTDISSTVVIDGAVNTSTPGVYTIKYTATNKDGFTATARRYVGVITAEAAAMDISGTYKRNAGALGLVSVTKTNYPGLYINNNPGGAKNSDGTNVSDIYVYMFQTKATVVNAPSQDTKVGEFACINGVYDATNNLFKWVCVNSGYGTALRTFIKQ
ncbi:DUF5011 domain-containing protein [Parabacteroides sp. FAFU027]|uniref:DUF5011 domain-containing protein n=1 Tax=Parabacteroides sp. FAFU027 TaxID=2922715 RepID=UPI001FAEE05A|nr:DUF5011 domain-containing protein [Parabacteroides sp. FAFU027]